MDALTAPSLAVDLLGSPGWRVGGGPGDALSSQDAALLALLALEGPQGRDVLAGQIWPQASKQQAANNLRKHVSRLRSDTGHTIFHTGATLSLAGGVQVDVLAIAQMAPDRLLDAEFLAGCDYGENDFLQTWVSERRAALRALRADALAGHAEALERRGELAAAIRLAERIVELAPPREHAWRRLMRLHYLRGDHTAAIDTFERFEHLLREETGARPGPETLQLLETIERGSRTHAPPTQVVPVSLVRPPTRIGRQAEWLAMGRAWSAARAFLLLGEAGIGKSRLLNDFAQIHGGAQIERARAGDVQAPYSLLARLLRGMLARPVPEPTGFTRTELSRLLPELGPAPQLPTQGDSLRDATESFLVSAAAHGVTALLVDDLHFADLATLEALRWLSASTALRDLRFGFAARPLDEAQSSALLRSWLDDSQRPERIELAPLKLHEVDELLASLDLGDFVAHGLGQRLFVHAGGHPLFTLETLKDAWLHRRDPGSDALPRPQTVQTLIERRLRALPSEALDLVRVAAVAGIDLTAERAARLLGASSLALADAWALLEKANVMQGLRFAHDLMQESALALVPQALRRALHALIAELLASDTTVPAGRVADHWQAAERWAEAGAWWQRAGIAARLAGRLPEQQALLERAAACHRQTGDAAAEFAAVHASFDGLLLRHGGSAVLAALPRLEALAKTQEAVIRCRLVQAEALLDVERSSEALDVAATAVRMAAEHARLIGDALCLQGMALAQLGRNDTAIAASRDAADAANAAGQPAQELRAVRSLAYVLYSAGRLGDSLPVQRRAARLAQALGDEAETAAADAAIAALLAASGDVPASYEHARVADRCYGAMGLAHNSTRGLTNLIVLGSSAAYLGRFDEALAALEAAERMAGDEAAASTHAKARISLGFVHLNLGNAAEARRRVVSLPAGTPPGMRMQAALLLARAEQLEGRSGREHFERLGRLGAEHPELPLVLSAWIEWSHQGDVVPVLERLHQVHGQFVALGLPGTARTVRLREVDRLAELDDEASIARAAAHAAELLPFVAGGMNAKTYPPEGWTILARAFERGGRNAAAADCRKQAIGWLRERALPHVPQTARETFLSVNAVNRALLDGAA